MTNDQQASVSSIFSPRFTLDGSLPNLGVTSKDGVHFHVHTRRLLAASFNGFGGTLLQPRLFITLPESAAVLNIVFHIIYGMSVLSYSPPLESTEGALDSMIKYGLPTSQLGAAPSLPLYDLLRSYAPHNPIEVYAVVARHRLENLAVAISSHLLAYDITRISDELCIKMGPIYFKRLVSLQQSRINALRSIVLQPPAMHPATMICNAEDQGELTRGWAFANAEIVWNALPSTHLRILRVFQLLINRPVDISISALESTFTKAAESVSCPECRAMLRQRIREVANEWSAVKVRTASL
ncbi:hypothetical protein C8Q73DRAFT_824947 [Cubamyces lactineus]|nr:hypothetical protein C8Q73DRAFT_824947 [Cubamyces lactineus]